MSELEKYGDELARAADLSFDDCTRELHVAFLVKELYHTVRELQEEIKVLKAER